MRLYFQIGLSIRRSTHVPLAHLKSSTSNFLLICVLRTFIAIVYRGLPKTSLYYPSSPNLTHITLVHTYIIYSLLYIYYTRNISTNFFVLLLFIKITYYTKIDINIGLELCIKSILPKNYAQQTPILGSPPYPFIPTEISSSHSK
jgi:hypothetical protein